jgi:DNA repair protein REV1
MFMMEAKKKCPELISLKYDFGLYEQVSEQIYDIFYSVPEALLVQPVSVDEAYIELPGTAKGLDIAQLIRQKVWDETKCPCSAGVGPNMLLAKLATRRAKPNGQFEINTENKGSVLRDMALSDLPGIGWRACSILRESALLTVQDALPKSREELQVV